MRILFCNKFNFAFSGTEVYLFALMKLLAEHGHDVGLFAMSHPANRPSPYSSYFVPYVDYRDKHVGVVRQVRLAGRAIYSLQSRRNVGNLVRDFRPDIAHVRNIYHQISPSILWELRGRGIPVVYHVNDFKLLCPSYNLVAHGSICERCASGAYHNVLRVRCHSSSFGSNAVLAGEAYLHRWLRTYEKCVSRFVVPSQFCREKLIEYGWPKDRIEVLYHFQHIPLEVTSPGDNDAGYVLYSGRIAAEKGVLDLIDAITALPHVPLIIAGDGPERPIVARLIAERQLTNVRMVGWVGEEEVRRLIAGARFTVMPSRAYETFGKVILESYAAGRPVVGSRLGTRPELVEDGVTGLLFQAGNATDLASKIAQLHTQPSLARQMGERGLARVRTQHSPQQHYDQLMRIYQRAMAP